MRACRPGCTFLPSPRGSHDRERTVSSMPSLFAKRTLALIAGLGSAPFGAGSVQSDAAPDSALTLPDAIVSATRTDRAPIEVPRAVNLVGAAALDDRMPRNSAEALREETGIMVQKTE